jgi:cephalosporin hydroxylase
VLYASLLELIGRDGLAVGVDVDIRKHNREALDAHPMRRRIRLIEGSSVDPGVVAEVAKLAKDRPRVLVTLDSNHTHQHVARELELYSPLVPNGSYLVCMDTIVEDFPANSFPDRPWDKGNNPKTAVREFLVRNRRFRIDHAIEDKLLISSNPEGFLECIAD